MGDFQQQLMLMAMMMGQRPGFESYRNLGSYDTFGTMPAAQITQAPGQLQFLNGILGALTGGQMSLPEPFLQNFHLRPRTGNSALFEGLVNQNTRNVSMLSRDAYDMQSQRVNALLNKGSVIRGLAGDKTADFLQQYVTNPNSLVGQMVIPQVYNVLSQITGHDPVGAANAINAGSIGVVSGMRALYGGGFRPGQDVGATLQDVLSGDFENERNAVSDSLFRATNQLSGTRAAHGITSPMIAQILSESMKHGTLGVDMDDYRDIRRERADLQTMKETKQQQFAQVNAQYAAKASHGDYDWELKKRGEQLDREIQSLTAALKDLDGKGAEFGDKVAKAGKTIVESVTATIDSMKDLFGDQESAARALSNLTGGEGLRDATLAKQIKRSLDEYKITAIAAGIDPMVAGEYLSKNVHAVASQWDTDRMADSRAAGQLGIAMSNMAMRGAAGIADPAEKRRYMEAQTAMAAEVGNSKGFKVKALLEYARENGMLQGQTGLHQNINRLMDSTNPADFQRAQRLVLSLIGKGSEAQGRKIMDSPDAMADIMSRLSPEASRRTAEWAADTNAREVQDRVDTNIRNVRRQNARNAMRDAGLSQKQIDELFNQATADAFVGEDGKGGEIGKMIEEAREAGNDKRVQDLTTARSRWEDVYDAEMERSGNKTLAEKKANAWLVDKGLKSTEDKERLLNASIKSVENVATRDSQFGSEEIVARANSKVFWGSRGKEFKQLLRDAGAIGESGDLNAASLGKVGKNIFKELKSGTYRDAQGNLISKKDAIALEKTFNEAMKENRRDDAARGLGDVIGNLDEVGRRGLAPAITDVYSTPEAIAARKQLSNEEQQAKDKLEERSRRARDQLGDLEYARDIVKDDDSLNQEAIQSNREELAALDRDYGTSAQKELARLEGEQSDKNLAEKAELEQSADARARRLEELDTKSMAAVLTEEEQTELKNLQDDDEKLLRLQEAFSDKNIARRQQLEKNLAPGAEYTAKYDEIVGRTKADRAAKEAQDVETGLSAIRKKQEAGVTDIDEMQAWVDWANGKRADSPLTKNHRYTAAKHAGAGNGAPLTPEQSETVETAVAGIEEPGAAAQEGVGRAFEKYLQDGQLDKFAVSVTGAADALEKLSPAIQKLLDTLGSGTASTGASGGVYANVPVAYANDPRVTAHSGGKQLDPAFSKKLEELIGLNTRIADSLDAIKQDNNRGTTGVVQPGVG